MRTSSSLCWPPTGCWSIAPLDGITKIVFRQGWSQFFGGVDRYFIPFFSPTPHHLMTPRDLREVDYIHNANLPSVPQVMTKNANDFLWTCDVLKDMGYTEVNLNLGCPSGTVTAKGKGSGFLAFPEELARFLDEIYGANLPIDISIKTRLGVRDEGEFPALLELYHRYPVKELTIHPRVMRQLYRGEADRAAFAKYLPHCRMPVCYNGDITTPAQLKALEAEFPNLSGIMVGRGIIADPALLRQAVGGAPASKEELRGYLDELYHGYTEAFGMASCAVSRMKAHWHYLIQRFEGSEAFEKQLRKAREGWEYEVVVNQLFTLPLI